MKIRALRITGLYTLRRRSAARGSVRPGRFTPTAHFTHILPALKMLRIFLFWLSKRRIQRTLSPICPEFFCKKMKKALTKYYSGDIISYI
jgi:hypothetical protein